MKLFEKMRDQPRGDWMIADVERVCRSFDITCSSPRGGGSHYKVSHPSQVAILIIPYRKPIKPVYIRHLVRFIEAVERDRHPQ